MTFNPEIKTFIKNTAILTIILATIINFSWDSITTMMGFSAKAENDKNFSNANIGYLGATASALSLRLGGITGESASTILPQSLDTISIAEVLSNTSIGQERLISSNMVAISAYANTLKTNILHMLESSNNRAITLDSHISLLKSYYLKTEDRIKLIRDQKNDLNALLGQSNNQQKVAKGTLANSTKDMKYSGVDKAIEGYLHAKNLESRARIYMIYLDRFEKSYLALQNKNRKVLDAIINNREAIIKKSLIVIPDTGTDIIKELGLIETEAENKAKKALENTQL